MLVLLIVIGILLILGLYLSYLEYLYNKCTESPDGKCNN